MKTTGNRYLIAAAVLLLLAAFGLQAAASMRHKSATWDETIYFGVGAYQVRTGRWDLKVLKTQPPMSYYIQSLPLMFTDFSDRIVEVYSGEEKMPGYARQGRMRFFYRSQYLLKDPGNREDRLLNASRMMTVLTALLLGVFIYRWSNELYGRRSAFLALFLFAFSPNLLAHARLITTEMPLTAFFFIYLYFFWKTLREPYWKYSIPAGIFLGMALLSKYSAILLLPISLILVLVWLARHRRIGIVHLAAMGALALGMIFLVYRGWPHAYIGGVLNQAGHVGEGHRSFLFGRYSMEGWWYYFLAAFFLKTPVPAMLLILPVVWAFVRGPDAGRRFNGLFVIIPAIFFFAFFSVKHLSLGLRYILPIYPLLFVFLSGVVADGRKIGKIAAAVLGLLMVWYVAGALRIHPHYLAYFNEIGGGPDKGYRYLVDSNLDWGQDLKGLGEYVAEEGIDRIHLSYFGTDAPERYGIDYRWLPSAILRRSGPGGPVRLPKKGWVAVSATNLQGIYLPDRDFFRELRDMEPVEKIGYSIFVYRLPGRGDRRDQRE